MRLLPNQAQAIAAERFITALQQDPKVEIVTSGPMLAKEAFDLFYARSDKDWSLAELLATLAALDRARQLYDGRWLG